MSVLALYGILRSSSSGTLNKMASCSGTICVRTVHWPGRGLHAVFGLDAEVDVKRRRRCGVKRKLSVMLLLLHLIAFALPPDARCHGMAPFLGQVAENQVLARRTGSAYRADDIAVSRPMVDKGHGVECVSALQGDGLVCRVG